MLKVFYFLFYNVVILPIMYIFIYILAIFNVKIRQGLIGRHLLFMKLRQSSSLFQNHPVIVLHCASMGEFEHTKPFLLEFKRSNSEFRIIVIFFSPSGYENIKTFSAVDLFLYSPNEWFLSIWRFMRKVKPKVWLIAKHDVWPNQLWFAHFFKIPIFLINASLHRQSSRMNKLTLSFNRSIYQYFTKILAVSENDRRNLSQFIDSEKLEVVGDTKYDQVIYRRDESQKIRIIPQNLLQNRWVFVAGSTWPADQEHLIPAVKSLILKYPNFLTILCPHEPTTQHIDNLKSQLTPIEYILLSDIASYSNQSFIIIDRIGVLANLYGLGKAAYVGGSFKQNVHNVLEPAVYKIPVLFGPVNQNSHEAQLLKANRGGWEINNAMELQNTLDRFILNDVYRQECGLFAYRIVERNLGATKKMVNSILSIFSHHNTFSKIAQYKNENFL